MRREGPGAHGKRRPRGPQPRLLRFFATGGLVDQDVAARMGTGEFWDEGVRLVSYGARGIRSSLSGMARHGQDIARGVADIVGALFGGSGR